MKIMSKIIKSGIIKCKKGDFLKNRMLIGIDVGYSMTKVIFLHKEDYKTLCDTNCESVPLNHGLFNNDDFEDAINWVGKEAYIPEGVEYLVRITGSKGQNKKDVVESILKVKSEYIDGTLSLIFGFRMALEYIGFENMVVPEVRFENVGEPQSTIRDRLFEGMKLKFLEKSNSQCSDETLIYPCLIQVCGSLTKFVYFNKEGEGELIRCQLIGEHMIKGLGKCLLDTNDYDEILKLASIGNRANVDTQVKDILSDAKGTPYGIFPKEMPLFPFGKCMDFNTGLEDYAREDVAASIIAIYCIMIIIEYFLMCNKLAMPKIYLSGHVFRNDILQKEIRRFLVMLPPIFEMELLDFDFPRCLGAMLCNNEEKDKYCL